MWDPTSDVYRGDIYCPDCASEIEVEPSARKYEPEDSDHVPQPVFADQDEADSPQHCADCKVFLENSLTQDGRAYVIERIRDHIADPEDGDRDILLEWAEFYDISAEELIRGEADE